MCAAAALLAAGPAHQALEVRPVEPGQPRGLTDVPRGPGEHGLDVRALEGIQRLVLGLDVAELLARSGRVVPMAAVPQLLLEPSHVEDEALPLGGLADQDRRRLGIEGL